MNALPPAWALSRTLRALAFLLRYPDADTRAALPAVFDVMAQAGALSPARTEALCALIDTLLAHAALDAEAAYVELFDRGRRTALHLFEHVHGDSRDRGAAMVDLARTYARAGLQLSEGELPDYLPVVLEFASTQPDAQARAFLGESAHIVRALYSALAERGSAYAEVMAAVLDLAGEPADRVATATEPPLDESWAEPEAFGGCSADGQRRPAAQPVHLVRPSPRPAA